MTSPKLQSYVAVENSVIAALDSYHQEHVAPLAGQVQRAVAEGSAQAALDTIGAWTPPPLAAPVRNRLQELFVSALLFGASRHKPVAETRFMTEKPAVLATALAQVENMVTRRTKALLVRNVSSMVEGHHEELRFPLFKSFCCRPVLKADDPYADLASRMNAVVDGTGKVMVDVAANLTTSRLTSYGFLKQAEQDGVQWYEITAQLDDRTCPVCQVMDGKRFRVGSAAQRAEHLLMLDDPEDLRTAAPFPSQTKDAVKQMRGMDADELQSRGWNMPPFHPSCRCMLVTVDNVPESDNSQPSPQDDDSSSSEFWAQIISLMMR